MKGMIVNRKSLMECVAPVKKTSKSITKCVKAPKRKRRKKSYYLTVERGKIKRIERLF